MLICTYVRTYARTQHTQHTHTKSFQYIRQRTNTDGTIPDSDFDVQSRSERGHTVVIGDQEVPVVSEEEMEELGDHLLIRMREFREIMLASEQKFFKDEMVVVETDNDRTTIASTTSNTATATNSGTNASSTNTTMASASTNTSTDHTAHPSDNDEKSKPNPDVPDNNNAGHNGNTNTNNDNTDTNNDNTDTPNRRRTRATSMAITNEVQDQLLLKNIDVKTAQNLELLDMITRIAVAMAMVWGAIAASVVYYNGTSLGLECLFFVISAVDAAVNVLCVYFMYAFAKQWYRKMFMRAHLVYEQLCVKVAEREILQKQKEELRKIQRTTQVA
ncbi:hypothetical protein RFI_16299 [Reticulomyxa filosa]|uniref:Transmembrane protein n=1 Tax=Reticulomyxa filosa TaxID=46433 RepID=X6N4U0_RETFI|nr:hypothetical protein RFI_16299 [Reticulomyxa filosa]|eukprot:ETO20908.1 hypothetical protein RFI_16299 [Reticulomyxa filosa]